MFPSPYVIFAYLFFSFLLLSDPSEPRVTLFHSFYQNRIGNAVFAEKHFYFLRFDKKVFHFVKNFRQPVKPMHQLHRTFGFQQRRRDPHQ